MVVVVVVAVVAAAVYTLRQSISALRILALNDDFLYVTYTTDFPLGGTDFWIIRTITPLIYSG